MRENTLKSSGADFQSIRFKNKFELFNYFSSMGASYEKI